MNEQINADLAFNIVSELQEVLRHERKHFNFYLQASMEIRGYERLFLKPLFEKEMESELQHVREFGDKIVAMGGTPTKDSHSFSLGGSLGTPPTGRSILVAAIKMEREILGVYHKLYPTAERFASVFNDMSVALILEENIEHTTKDVEEMEKILAGLPAPTDKL